MHEGQVADGMPCLDEATAAALAGEHEEIVAAGWTFCFLLTACERSARLRARGGVQRRITLHSRFADWTAALPAGDDLVEIVAYHLAHACRLASQVARTPEPPPVLRAVDALTRAAEKSARRGAGDVDPRLHPLLPRRRGRGRGARAAGARMARAHGGRPPRAAKPPGARQVPPRARRPATRRGAAAPGAAGGARGRVARDRDLPSPDRGGRAPGTAPGGSRARVGGAGNGYPTGTRSHSRPC